MSLLQITEPDTKVKTTEKYALGIDLGTTNSLVAVSFGGETRCLPDGNKQILLPSVVNYATTPPTVGTEALIKQKTDPVNTVSSAKRLLGKTLADLSPDVSLPFAFEPSDNIIKIKTKEGVKTPIDVAGAILTSLYERARQALGTKEIVGAVITVPAYFDDAQRQATKDAAALAGIPLLRLINEPTAAAVAYGLENQATGIFVVYDLGGGTLDVSILTLTKGLFKVLATGGNTALGGDDFDELICNHWRQKYQLSALNPQELETLKALARQLKEEVTAAPQARCRLNLSSGKHQELTLSRSEFIKLTQPLADKTLASVKLALQDAGKTTADISGVILVGGSTRMPHIQTTLKKFFGQELLTNLNPETVVAVGAAKQANLLLGNQSDDDWLLLDVTPLSLGLETYGGLAEVIIPRNSSIPVAKAQEFTTFKDGQTSMLIHVVQGERDLVADCRSLARFTLTGIPPLSAGAARILVTFQIDANGILNVAAKEKSTGTVQKIAVKPSYGLSDTEITQMLQESITHAADDARRRRLAEAKTEAESLLTAVRDALNTDADLLTPGEITAIQTVIDNLELELTAQNSTAIREKTQLLAEATDSFAEKRMDRNLNRALSGRHVDQV